MWEIIDYLTHDGRDLYAEWLADLADRQASARVAVGVLHMATASRYKRACGSCGLTMAHGYRIYYAQAGKRLVLLLIGGDKRRQQSDIAAAVDYWKDWQKRNEHESRPKQ